MIKWGELVQEGKIQIFTTPDVLEEVRRNIEKKFPDEAMVQFQLFRRMCKPIVFPNPSEEDKQIWSTLTREKDLFWLVPSGLKPMSWLPWIEMIFLLRKFAIFSLFQSNTPLNSSMTIHISEAVMKSEVQILIRAQKTGHNARFFAIAPRTLARAVHGVDDDK